MYILDSKIIIHINNKNVTPLEIEMEFMETNNMEIVQQILIALDAIKSCNGVVSFKDNADIKQSFGIQFIECNGRWCHINYLTVVKDGKKYE